MTAEAGVLGVVGFFLETAEVVADGDTIALSDASTDGLTDLDDLLVVLDGFTFATTSDDDSSCAFSTITSSFWGTTTVVSVSLISSGLGFSTALASLDSVCVSTTTSSGSLAGGSTALGVGSADLASSTTVGDTATGLVGSFGLEGMALAGDASSVFDGVAALMGLLFLRGVCLVRGDDILGERAAFVLFTELWLIEGEVVSMESVAVGLLVVGLLVDLLAGGVIGDADLGGSFGDADGVVGGLSGDWVGRVGTTVFGWLDKGVSGGGVAGTVLTGVIVVELAAFTGVGFASTGVGTTAVKGAAVVATGGGGALTTSVFCDDISRSNACFALAFWSETALKWFGL